MHVPGLNIFASELSTGIHKHPVVNPYEYGAEATLLELFAFTFLAPYLNQENLFFADYSNYLPYILLKFYILLRLLSYSWSSLLATMCSYPATGTIVVNILKFKLKLQSQEILAYPVFVLPGWFSASVYPLWLWAKSNKKIIVPELV